MAPGTLLPPFRDFVLQAFDSAEARQEGLLAILFWRSGCSTSRLTLPFWQRLSEYHPDVRVLAISQDDEHTTAEYCVDNRITLEQLIDAPSQSVSRLFAVHTVPSFFVTDASGKVLISGVGWDVKTYEMLNSYLAMRSGREAAPLVSERDGVPASKPG